MKLDPEERGNIRLVLAAVAMHGLLSGASTTVAQTAASRDTTLAQLAVMQADQLLSALAKEPSQ